MFALHHQQPKKTQTQINNVPMASMRQIIMRGVREKIQRSFKETVETMVKENPFLPDQCMVLEIARASATNLGLSPDVVEMVTLNHNRKCAQFTHQVHTPVPPPENARKGTFKKEPPVFTKTRLMVVAESGKIVAKREFIRTDEVEEKMGGEVEVTSRQRPNRKQF